MSWVDPVVVLLQTGLGPAVRCNGSYPAGHLRRALGAWTGPGQRHGTSVHDVYVHLSGFAAAESRVRELCRACDLRRVAVPLVIVRRVNIQHTFPFSFCPCHRRVCDENA